MKLVYLPLDQVRLSRMNLRELRLKRGCPPCSVQTTRFLLGVFRSCDLCLWFHYRYQQMTQINLFRSRSTLSLPINSLLQLCVHCSSANSQIICSQHAWPDYFFMQTTLLSSYFLPMLIEKMIHCIRCQNSIPSCSLSFDLYSLYSTLVSLLKFKVIFFKQLRTNCQPMNLCSSPQCETLYLEKILMLYLICWGFRAFVC